MLLFLKVRFSHIKYDKIYEKIKNIKLENKFN